jgi:hypothetical protein
MGFPLTLLVGGLEPVRVWLRRWRGVELGTELKGAFGGFFTVKKRGERLNFVWFPSVPRDQSARAALVAHEVQHLILRDLRHVGLKASRETEEVFAYEAKARTVVILDALAGRHRR